MNISRFLLATLLVASYTGAVSAHHNPIAYDGKKEVQIQGTVTSTYYGDPHSRFGIDVINEAGETEQWLLMTEDPRDARALGFDEAIKSIEVGDPINVLGWPHRSKEREIRGHQLHYTDGTVVMMRTGNYIWTRDMRVIFRIVSGDLELDDDVVPTSPELTDPERVIYWIEEQKILQRIALETRNRTARLVGFREGDSVTFPGVASLMRCHTEREDFTMVLNSDDMTEEQSTMIDSHSEFVSRFNATLSRYWEQDVESC